MNKNTNNQNDSIQRVLLALSGENGTMEEHQFHSVTGISEELKQLRKAAVQLLTLFASYVRTQPAEHNQEELRAWTGSLKERFKLSLFDEIYNDIQADKSKADNELNTLFSNPSFYLRDEEGAITINPDAEEVEGFVKWLVIEPETSQFLLDFTNRTGIYGTGEILLSNIKLKKMLPGLEATEASEDSSEAEHDDCEEKRPVLKLFDFELLNNMAGNRDLGRRHSENIRRILATESEHRRLAQVDERVQESVNKLADSFPNFKSTIDYFRGQIALASLTSDRVFKAHPVLLVGPPGVGKTAFVEALAAIINVGFRSLDMGGVTAGFTIGGNSPQWADGSSGIVFNLLRDGEAANPFILLDELDKTSANRHHNPFGPLHSLLEEQSAKSFTDESVDIPIDASNVVWVATANKLESIPEPVLSRFNVVQVEKATGEEARNVIRSVWRSIREREPWGDAFSENLSDEVIRELEAEIPREAKRVLKEACGCIAMRQSKKVGHCFVVTVFDLPRKEDNREQAVVLH